MPYDPTIYLGSAAHYRCGRPAYSPDLESALTRRAGPHGNGRLLDVGCGPGVLTVRLAHLFAQAVGLDPDVGMLAEGRRDDRLDDFAAEVRALLANRSAEGIFWDWPGDTEVVMARKPG
jgi:trans-aconitate methyltransferase